MANLSNPGHVRFPSPTLFPLFFMLDSCTNFRFFFCHSHWWKKDLPHSGTPSRVEVFFLKPQTLTCKSIVPCYQGFCVAAGQSLQRKSQKARFSFLRWPLSASRPRDTSLLEGGGGFATTNDDGRATQEFAPFLELEISRNASVNFLIFAKLTAWTLKSFFSVKET